MRRPLFCRVGLIPALPPPAPPPPLPLPPPKPPILADDGPSTANGPLPQVCTELDNHLGLSDEALAEFIIHLSEDVTSASNLAARLRRSRLACAASVSRLLLYGTSRLRAVSSFIAPFQDPIGQALAVSLVLEYLPEPEERHFGVLVDQRRPGPC